MTDDIAVVVSPALVRALAEFAGLPLAEDRLETVATALKDMLAGRAALDTLDVSNYEPGPSFDPAWQ
jgi:Asp-tRNA(Asn)/Glu-tRNA(Gln) amidotransferase C subunit